MKADISKHITYQEATASKKAKELWLTNDPPPEVLAAMKLTAEMVFEPLREIIGRPVGISSFYRSPEVNRAIGGSDTSQHCKGEAIDIDGDITAVDNGLIFDTLRLMDFDQLIWEFGTADAPRWVHVSYRRSGNRGQVLKSIKEGGRTKYVLI